MKPQQKGGKAGWNRALGVVRDWLLSEIKVFGVDFFKNLPLLGIFTNDWSDRLERSSNQIWRQLEMGGFAYGCGGQD